MVTLFQRQLYGINILQYNDVVDCALAAMFINYCFRCSLLLTQFQTRDFTVPTILFEQSAHQ